MSKSIKIRKGLDIRIKGEAERSSIEAPLSSTYAIKPTDFHGLIPKLLKKVGDQVKAGTPIFLSDSKISIGPLLNLPIYFLSASNLYYF